MKRRQRTILKSLDRVMDEARNGKDSGEHQQIQRLKKVHLERDEFTEHKVIENALVSFVVEARQLEDHYQGHRKRMIQTVALALADELDSIGKSELICHISEELMKVLKQTGIKWNAIYLRRCLEERYKDPANRLNALARQRHPGVPQDTGLTAEQLQEQRLNRKPSGWGQEYKVRTNAEYTEEIHSRKEYDELSALLRSIVQGEVLPNRNTKYDVLMRIKIPLKVTCRPAEQGVIVELDKDVMIKNAQYYKGVKVKDAQDKTES